MDISNNEIKEEKTHLHAHKEHKIGEPEVFNISNNLYSYKEAQAVCSSYDGRLATYSEIENAYNHGAEFCNYGWSDAQLLLYPTQKKTWELLQQSEKKNACGRPGVNGGYVANAELKYGVNCFAIKPDAKSTDKIQTAIKIANKPETKELEQKVVEWKKNADKLLILNSFNTERWKQ
jgi:hypothetical protein